jgi:hypothetical protein
MLSTASGSIDSTFSGVPRARSAAGSATVDGWPDGLVCGTRTM